MNLFCYSLCPLCAVIWVSGNASEQKNASTNNKSHSNKITLKESQDLVKLVTQWILLLGVTSIHSRGWMCKPWPFYPRLVRKEIVGNTSPQEDGGQNTVCHSHLSKHRASPLPWSLWFKLTPHSPQEINSFPAENHWNSDCYFPMSQWNQTTFYNRKIWKQDIDSKEKPGDRTGLRYDYSDGNSMIPMWYNITDTQAKTKEMEQGLQLRTQYDVKLVVWRRGGGRRKIHLYWKYSDSVLERFLLKHLASMEMDDSVTNVLKCLKVLGVSFT